MVNADHEVFRSRRLLEIAKEIRDFNRRITERLQLEIERSKKLQAELRWMRYFRHGHLAHEFFQRLDDQCTVEKEVRIPRAKKVKARPIPK